ncbi:MAG: hydrogenase maturation protease, partial [Acidimicrobiales bacterium]
MSAGDDVRTAGAPDLEHRFAAAKGVADTVCYEGYVLYPYRASARKNQLRWQFGVLAPPSVAAGGSEPSAAQTEFVIEARGTAGRPRLHVRLRALQVQQRGVEAADGDGFVPVASLDDGDEVWASFDEAVEHQTDVVDIALDAASEQSIPVDLSGDRQEESIGAAGTAPGRVVRQTWPVTGRLDVRVTPLDGPYPLTRVTLGVRNQTGWTDPGASRDEAMRRSLVATHVLVAVDGGRPISSLDPPRFAAEAVGGCTNTGLFPILVGDGGEDDILASPIILYDHPALAPESAGDMFDATEIDEILALRVMTLTDEEKREARGTDPRSAAIIDRCSAMGVDALDALHGTFRSIRELTPDVGDGFADEPPWWEPQVDAAFDPWSDTIVKDGVTVGNGTRVRLHPQRRSDAQDFFVDGRDATVAGVFNDVGGDVYLAVAVDDPDADLHQWHGRYLYFHPDEVEVLVASSTDGASAAVAAPEPERPRVLVAGVGNIFFGDDGFGVEVARRLDPASAPAGVKVADFGIRGVHLAYELLEGYDILILIDAVSRGDPPGTVSVIEHAAEDNMEGGTLAAMDAHGMDPGAVM